MYPSLGLFRVLDSSSIIELNDRAIELNIYLYLVPWIELYFRVRVLEKLQTPNR